MSNLEKFYIGGGWVDPASPNPCEVINPATEEAFASINLGSAADVDRAVAAAKAAFPSFSQTSREERVEMFERILGAYQARSEDIAAAITTEMGAPLSLSKNVQVMAGAGHFHTAMEILKTFPFESDHDAFSVFKEPIGVCGLITPWNWPMNQVACKLAPALAVGCTVVLKPSELSPVSATIFAEIMDQAGVPAGAFNLVQGDGPTVGHAMATHPDIDMISVTGSTRAGAAVAIAAAPTIKRVSQELGGKAANILLDDADFEACVARDLSVCFLNTGQGCNAPTRMLVPKGRVQEAAALAKAAVDNIKVGPPEAEDTTMGPLVSRGQWDRVQGLIQQGIDESATLVCGGTGRPEGFDKGYYVRPTVFADVTNDMTIAREEIFGPVLSILGYDDDEDAIRIANESPYGLSGYVSSASIERARKIASRLRAGMIYINGQRGDFMAPFGGYKQSGNGREWGTYGFDEFLETKAVLGYQAAAE